MIAQTFTGKKFDLIWSFINYCCIFNLHKQQFAIDNRYMRFNCANSRDGNIEI